MTKRQKNRKRIKRGTEQNEDLEKKKEEKKKDSKQDGARKGRVCTWLEGSVLSKQTEIEAVITPCVTAH